MRSEFEQVKSKILNNISIDPFYATSIAATMNTNYLIFINYKYLFKLEEYFLYKNKLKYGDIDIRNKQAGYICTNSDERYGIPVFSVDYYSSNYVTLIPEIELARFSLQSITFKKIYGIVEGSFLLITKIED